MPKVIQALQSPHVVPKRHWLWKRLVVSPAPWTLFLSVLLQMWESPSCQTLLSGGDFGPPDRLL